MVGHSGSGDLKEDNEDTAVSGSCDKISARYTNMVPKAQGNTESRLLRLPPELRVRIWEDCLIEVNNPIVVSATLNQPAMLSVCHLVHHEALGIWYRENDLEIRVINCDARLLRSFVKHYKSLNIPLKRKGSVNGLRAGPSPGISVSGAHWQNILQWAQWVHCHEVYGLRCAEESDNDTESVVCAIMDIAETAAENMVPWEACNAMIEGLQDMACRSHSSWQ